MALSEQERKRLEHLEAAFESVGGRGVDLADEIDVLRLKEAVHGKVLKAHLNDLIEACGGDDDALVDVLLEKAGVDVSDFPGYEAGAVGYAVDKLHI